MPIDYNPLGRFAAWQTGGNTGVGGGGGASPSLPLPSIPTPASFADLGRMASTVTGANIASQRAALGARIPGAAGLESQSSKLIGQELAGQVPQDVMRLLAQQGAEGAAVTGGNPNAAYLKALGLTSLDLTGRGESELSAAYARNPAAPIFDASTGVLTPGQAGQLAISGGQLQLAGQTEADRVALENRRLAIDAQELALRGRGGGGGGGAVSVPPPTAPGLPMDVAYNMFGPIGPNNPAFPTGPIVGLPDQNAPSASVPYGQDWSAVPQFSGAETAINTDNG